MTIKINTEEDIAQMRIAGRLASEVLDYITPHIQPGITTKQIDLLCAEAMEKQGKGEMAVGWLCVSTFISTWLMALFF